MMRVRGAKSLGIGLVLLAALALFLSAAAAPPSSQQAAVATSQIVLMVDPTQSQLHWVLGSTVHDVHGTFNVESGTITINPETGAASGDVLVYATSGDSDNNARDTKMHKDVLESAKYPEVKFIPKQIDGKVATTGASDVKIHGTLSLHGADHEMTADVHAEISDGKWNGTAKFDVPYVQWGLKDPSNFLLKAKPVVNIEIKLAGTTRTAK